MKRKILILISVLMAVMICTSCAVIDSLFERTISEETVESYLNDSVDAVAYLFAYDVDNANKMQLDGDIKVRLSATTYKARTKDIETDDSTYLIPKEKMEEEINAIFSDTDISDFKNNDFVSRNDNGTYHLVNGDWGDSYPVFKITDAFYGIIGSEPTRITVRYTFTGEEEMSNKYDYEAHFTLVEDKKSPYTFKITEFSGKNLIPVDNVKDIAQATLREGIIYDGFTDASNPWFYVYEETVKDKKQKKDEDDSWPYNLNVPRYEATDGTPITEEEANEIIDGYTAKYMQLDLRPISERYEILED